jgi:signal transduction histidine kinase/ligand-binding sensor domain-containing protein
VRRVAIVSTLVLLAAVVAEQARAERLPARAYTSGDGLGHDRVLCAVQDSRGFLWFCTGEGVSRFDGYHFTNYGVADGLPAPPVYAFVETRPGVYWIGAHGGLARLDDATRVTTFAVDPDPAERSIFSFVRGRDGRLWAGGIGRVLQVDEGREPVRIAPLSIEPFGRALGSVRALLEDREGSLWLAAERGIVRRAADGRVTSYVMQSDPQSLRARAIIETDPGTYWVGTGERLVVLRPGPADAMRPIGAKSFMSPPPCAPDVAQVCEYATAIGPAGARVRSLTRAPDGTVWIGAVNGLTSFDGKDFRTYAEANGLSNETVNAITIDRAGNMWVGTDLGGVVRIAARGLVTFDGADGLGRSDIGQIVQDDAGVIGAVTLDSGQMYRFDGRRFHEVAPNLSAAKAPTSSWWTLPGSRVSTAAKHDGARIYAIFPHSSGDLWLAEHTATHDNLARWRRQDGTLQRFSELDGVPPFNSDATLDTTLTFVEDEAHQVWIGFVDGGLIRFRDGRFWTVLDTHGVPLRNLRAVALDPRGRLWAATVDGLWRVDDPVSPAARAARVLPNLAAAQVRCLAIDVYGRLYLGTNHGVQQVDAERGRVIRTFTHADGLAHNEVLAAFRDRSGALWFGTYVGMSRLVPPSESADPPPPVFISSVRIAGDHRPIARPWETRIADLELAPDQRQITLDFGGLAYGVGDPLRYQFRLVGADDGWTEPGDTRSVSYAHLSRGDYRFEARAVTVDGVVSATPAVVSFHVLAPLWSRWWFVASVCALVASVVHLFYRMRAARLVELERIRTRIASDLHDDIGANLSRIALMSDVAQRQVVGDPASAGGLLASVATISRESVDAMSDIVWAVDPSRDRLTDLAQRMRRFASDVLAARDVAVTFAVPPIESHRALSADVRRETLLIFKETVNNIARHARATRVTVESKVDRGELVLCVTDDGRGFDPTADSSGTGLASMKRRAERLGGNVTVRSTPGIGTVVELRVPTA